MTNLTSVLNQLEQERRHLNAQLKALGTAISTLNGAGTSRPRRTLSAAVRARIAAAQRARWAKGKVVSISKGRRRRKMSAAAIAKIRAAQKTRWAKWRKAKKTG